VKHLLTQKRQALYVLHHFQANESKDQNPADCYPLLQLKVRRPASPLSGLVAAIGKIKAQLQDSATNHHTWKTALFLRLCSFLLSACYPRQIGTKPLIEFTNIPFLHPLIRDEVYRIGREALVNAFRHSPARNIEVEVRYVRNQLQMLIHDDGCGINAQVLRSGREGHWGLLGICERAERIGARLKVRNRIATGTEVELSVPGTIAYESRSSDHLLKWFTGFQPQNIRARFRKQKSEAKQ
jgi:signal transduction histidine kinase